METYCYPDMKEEVKRLVSFQHYPMLSSADEESMSRFNSPMKLSNAGFFRQPDAPSDEVTCFACSVTFSGWKGQSPLAVHRVLNPECPFLNEQGEDQLASLATSDSNAVRRRLFETPERNAERDRATDSDTPSHFATPTRRKNLLSIFKPVCGGYEMLFESFRLLTYQDPSNRQSEEWAACGFIYRPENSTVKCVFCGMESSYESEQPPFEVHRSTSADCPIVKYIDVGNITRELEHSVKSQQLNLDTNGQSRRSLAYLHPQFEDAEDRRKTFEYWPCLPQTEEQLIEAGFYFTGVSDKVVCFACGCSLRKWRPTADPWVEHARHSPDCQFVKEKKGADFIQQAAQITEVLTHCDPPQEGPVRTEGPVCTVSPGKPHLDMSAVAAALECGQYPNTPILLGLLQATDKNFNMLQQQRQKTHIKERELQLKNGELQKEREIAQMTYHELQRRNEELEREREELERSRQELELVQREAEVRQQTHRALVEGQAAVIHRHVQEIRNREQNYNLLQQNYQQQLQQRDEMLQQRDEMLQQHVQQSMNYQQQLYIFQQQLDNQTEQLENKQQIQDNQMEMIRRLANELSRVGRDLRDIPDDVEGEEDNTAPPGVRCKVCLSEEVNVLFRPCRHVCCGSQCAPQFIGKDCPVCRSGVQEWELVFVS